ncbi:hypothetical protein THIX_60291 [Thiomonas sp. X19]|nr:hypothetical protein THIX_60291 [Thiomonas sp. X19]
MDSNTLAATARPTRTPLNRDQIRGFWAAWFGWTLDGMDSIIYALVLVPALTELLPKSGIAATPGNIGLAGSILFALFLVGWGLSFIWGPIADRFGRTVAVVGGGVSNAGRPRLPLRLMVSLLDLKHAFNLSDEDLVERWSQDVLWQFFSGRAYFEHSPPCDASQIVRFRGILGEAGVEELLAKTLQATVEMQVVKPQEFERVIVDTTV